MMRYFCHIPQGECILIASGYYRPSLVTNHGSKQAKEWLILSLQFSSWVWGYYYKDGNSIWSRDEYIIMLKTTGLHYYYIIMVNHHIVSYKEHEVWPQWILAEDYVMCI